jgi:DNA-directed RNA polymerase subunit M/transcription elongation factor TFIIS
LVAVGFPVNLRQRVQPPLRQTRDEFRTATLKPRAAARHVCRDNPQRRDTRTMAKIAKTGDRKKIMDTTKSTDCPKCSKPTRIVKRVKDRERGVPGGVYISCSACDFYEKL